MARPLASARSWMVAGVIPSTWAFTLLALAAYRCFRLIAEDTILDPLRDRFVRAKFSEFVTCPWCAGAWIALGWWATWYWASSEWTLVVAVPFALSAVVGVLGMTVSRISDD